MKLMTFSEINDLENGQPVSSFQGTIKKVFKQLSDVGDFGQWWLQNIILQDDHANELTVTWTCEDAWTSKDEGKQMLFESGFNQKEQLVGIKREIKTKGSKRYESVKVDDRAKVKTLNGKPAQASNDYIIREPEFPPQSDPKGGMTDSDWPEAFVGERESSPSHPLNDAGVTEARKHLMKSANLYNLCVSAVDKAIAPNMPNIAQTSEQFQAAVASLFIEASREVWWSGKIVKPSLIEQMPCKPL